MAKPMARSMGWAGVVRLGLVQSALGAVVGNCCLSASR